MTTTTMMMTMTVEERGKKKERKHHHHCEGKSFYQNSSYFFLDESITYTTRGINIIWARNGKSFQVFWQSRKRRIKGHFFSFWKVYREGNHHNMRDRKRFSTGFCLNRIPWNSCAFFVYYFGARKYPRLKIFGILAWSISRSIWAVKFYHPPTSSRDLSISNQLSSKFRREPVQCLVIMRRSPPITRENIKLTRKSE